MVLIAVFGILLFFFVLNFGPFKDTARPPVTPKPVAKAAGASVVKIQNGKLYVNGSLFTLKAINYQPTAVGSDQGDATAPIDDVPKMAQMGANTVAVYSCSKFEWDQWSDAGSGDVFCNNLLTTTEQQNMKLIVGYFSNQAMDWTNSTRITKVTQQYQSMVLSSKDRPPTLIYMIGNETFEKMANDTQRTAYAKWIGQMVDWTHLNDPNHPVMYADNDQKGALNWLKTYAPSIDIYGTNSYNWSTATELKTAFDGIKAAWPGKPFLLHEWGVDSLNAPTQLEDLAAQASRVNQLLQVIAAVYADTNYPLLGHIFFEYTDDWSKLGTISSQTPDPGWPWSCKTPFDGKCNEEYWGITTAQAAGQAKNRSLKPVYYTFQSLWKNTINTPTPTPTPGFGSPTPPPTGGPTATPTPLPNLIDNTPPQISLTYPVNNAILNSNTNITITATASDNVGVAKVEFYVNNAMKCTDSRAAFSCKFRTPKTLGPLTITAKAYDRVGNVSLSTSQVTVN